ncbi:MAG: bifunctional UDP-N-acetylglucosamine diphosphorylase/glucosamine-1-phosphate N-acetyltransferase GlmU [Gammaproteobacteria bacterium]|nr:bifunctional UDP-N-acetylglucosamine diphosphorylase/glucosamine-1-phosphate N-acetyltransferase GlmU [Gammaproteobacteria bacterium]
MATHSPLTVIVLAAGEGKRMASALPKALHRIGGRTLLDHVVWTAQQLGPDDLLAVIGHGAEEVKASTQGAVRWVVQRERLGTGHAVAQALPLIDDAAVALVLCADVPLVGQATLQACVDAAREGALALVTAELDDPAALGRIVRGGDGRIVRIVEFKDADERERTIREVNAGLMALPAAVLRRLLGQVTPDNAQGEYYLTDLVALAIAEDTPVEGIRAQDADEILGINDRAQLAKAERILQQREAQRLLAAGVTLADPARLDVRGDVTAGQDSFIDANAMLKGCVTLGERVHLGPGVVIEDAEIGDDAHIEAYTIIEGARIGARCRIGPFARLRPGTSLGEAAKVGNFVETKNARLGAGVKASHLAYLGDADIGADSNIGAGAVTCNYDGADKHRTEIGDDVFIGTNATLVAPLTIETGAFIAAGSTITRAVGKEELAVGRGRQRNIDGWTRPGRKSR